MLYVLYPFYFCLFTCIFFISFGPLSVCPSKLYLYPLSHITLSMLTIVLVCLVVERMAAFILVLQRAIPVVPTCEYIREVQIQSDIDRILADLRSNRTRNRSEIGRIRQNPDLDPNIKFRRDLKDLQIFSMLKKSMTTNSIGSGFGSKA